MALDDVVMLQVKGVVNDTQHIHTLHFKQVLPDILVTDLITKWTSSASAAYRACFPGGQSPCQLIRVDTVCSAFDLPAPAEVVPAPSDQLGTQLESVDLMPAFIASTVALKSDLAGRRRQGRFFLGGLMESDSARNNLSGAYIARVQAYCDALKAQFVTPSIPNWRLVVFSRTILYGANPPSPPVKLTTCGAAIAEVRNMIVNPRPTTMRSRKVGHGL